MGKDLTVAQRPIRKISDALVALEAAFSINGLNARKLRVIVPSDQWQRLLEAVHDYDFYDSFVVTGDLMVIHGITFERDSAQ